VVGKKSLLLAGLVAFSLGAVLFAVLLTGQVPSMIFPETPPLLREHALSFLTEVVGFNLTEYSIVHSEYSPSTDMVSSNGLPITSLSYTLQSSENKVHASFGYTLENGNYTLESYSHIYLDSPAFVYPPYPPDNLLNWTKSFMERYQSFQSDVAYVSEMRKTLDTVDRLEPLNVTSGSIKLQISIKQFNVNEIYTSITFLYTSEGVDYEGKAVGFNFHNGLYAHFADTWNKVKVGNEHVIVLEDEALSMAWQQAESYVQDKFGNETARKLQSTPKLMYLSAEHGGAGTFYPMWRIEFGFDEPFYSATDAVTLSYIEVGIWAYNRQVAFCRAL